MLTPKDFTQLKTFDSDMLQPKVDYAITINPDDNHQWFDHPDRAQQFYKYYSKLFAKLKSSNKVLFYLECSHPKESNNSRLHFHGVIRFSAIGINKWYHTHLNLLKKTSMVKIHDICNKETWYNYMVKNADMVKCFSKYYSIPYPIYNFYPKYICRHDSTADTQPSVQKDVAVKSA